MPIYEYQCSSCGKISEALQKFSDPPLKACPNCETESLKRLVSQTSFHLKGSGWYATDYKPSQAKTVNKEGAKEGGAKESSASSCGAPGCTKTESGGTRQADSSTNSAKTGAKS